MGGSHFRYVNSMREGRKAEALFARVAQARGWHVQEANHDQDVDEHWDFLITRGTEAYRVDVKAMKRVNRNDPDVQDRLHWVEYRNVHGRTGWLFGKADLFAFETRSGFVIVERRALLTLVNQKVDHRERVTKPEDAVYKIYERPNRRDETTLVPVEDLKKIAKWFWPLRSSPSTPAEDE